MKELNNKRAMDGWKQAGSEQSCQGNRCYLCNNTVFKKRRGSVRDKPEVEVFECVSCGLVFLSLFDHIGAGYYENSRMHGEKPSDIQTWLKETAQDDERRFQYLKPVLPNRSLLDFGCGAGGFLLKASKIAKVAHGVELETHLNAHYRGHNISVFHKICDIPKDAGAGRYDVITMFHVLEHIRDPKSMLLEMSQILAVGGQIVIEVPNADDALLTLYNSEQFSDFTYWGCHLFLYTAKTLQMLFDKINLKTNYITHIQRYPLSNHLFWLANGRPGGHKEWRFLDSPELHAAYEKQLAAIGKCDTLLASVSIR